MEAHLLQLNTSALPSIPRNEWTELQKEIASLALPFIVAHLAIERHALLGSDELAVGLVGSDDHCGYCFLVLR